MLVYITATELTLPIVSRLSGPYQKLRDVIQWAMCKLGVEEWLVLTVMSMYTGEKSVVRTVYCNSSDFEVKVGMHQGSALSPLLFVIVMEAISREFRVALPWDLLYADDLVVIAETRDVKSIFKHSKFVCSYLNFIPSSKMAAAVLHCSGDSMNCGKAYYVDDMHHFLCWSPGDDVQRPQAASVQ